MGETTPFKRPGIFRSAHLLYLAQISFQAQQYERVRDLCLEILKAAPDDPEALFLLGLSYYYMQDHTQAIPYLLKLLDDVPDYPEVHYFLGKCHKLTNNNFKAIEHLKLAFLYDQKNKKAPYSLYEIHHEAKELVEAKEYLIQVMLLSPNDKKLWMELGLLLKEQSLINEAQDVLNRTELLGNGPFQKPGTNALYALGEYLFLSRDTKKANLVFQKLLMEEINDLSSLSYLSYIAFGKKQINRGYDLLIGLEEIIQKSIIIKTIKKHVPIWRGEDLKNKKIYIYKGNSLALELLAAHCFNDVLKVAQEVYIETSEELFDLFTQSFPKAQICISAKKELIMDYEISSFHLLRLLRSDVDACQFKKPYIEIFSEDKKRWQEELQTHGFGAKIGVDRSLYKITRLVQETFPQNQDWSQLTPVKDQLFIDLMNDEDGESSFIKLNIKPSDFKNYAALIASLDLVITSNIETAHLAGAMGVSCYYLTNGFEWVFYGEDQHPFYKSLNVFKKDYFVPWHTLINEVNEKLRILKV